MAVMNHFCELKLAFVVTEFPQKVRVKGITNPSLIEYMTVRVKKGCIVIALVEKVSQKISLTPNHMKSYCQKILINDKVLQLFSCFSQIF